MLCFPSSCSFLHIAVAQGRRALSYVLARKMAALHMLDIKEHNGQVCFSRSLHLLCAPECLCMSEPSGRCGEMLI